MDSNTVRGTTKTIAHDSVGDFISRTGDGDITLTASTSDSAGGIRSTTVNSRVTTTRNLYDSVTGKSYTGGINESYNLNGDGSVAGVTIYGSAAGTSAAISQTPSKWMISCTDGLYGFDMRIGGPQIMG